MPRPRFTLRWLMVAVAVASIALGAIVTFQRHYFYRRMASHHAVAHANGWQFELYDRDVLRRKSAYHAEMKAKYERAAR
jgi:hypothetical protein